MTTVANIGERQTITQLTSLLSTSNSIVVGPGDDCAVVKMPSDPDHDYLLTSDPVIEGIHFESGTTPSLIGNKAIGRVLSDIAAMGGQPLHALINIVAPSDTETSLLAEIMSAANSLAASHKLTITGGDLSNGPLIELHVFATGFLPSGSALLRSKAAPGDHLFVTGSLGGSRSGKHLSFTPRVAEGIWLRDWASAMIDLSDGLSVESNIVASMSSVGIRLNQPDIPISDAAQDNIQPPAPLHRALNDGEDFELLFTIPPRKRDTFLAQWKSTFTLKCTCIGEITDNTSIVEMLHQDGHLSNVSPAGYQHFVHA